MSNCLEGTRTYTNGHRASQYVRDFPKRVSLRGYFVNQSAMEFPERGHPEFLFLATSRHLVFCTLSNHCKRNKCHAAKQTLIGPHCSSARKKQNMAPKAQLQSATAASSEPGPSQEPAKKRPKQNAKKKSTTKKQVQSKVDTDKQKTIKFRVFWIRDQTGAASVDVCRLCS